MKWKIAQFYRIEPTWDICDPDFEPSNLEPKAQYKENTSQQIYTSHGKHFSEKIINTSNLVNFEIIFFLIGRSSGRLLFDFK